MQQFVVIVCGFIDWILITNKQKVANILYVSKDNHFSVWDNRCWCWWQQTVRWWKMILRPLNNPFLLSKNFAVAVGYSHRLTMWHSGLQAAFYEVQHPCAPTNTATTTILTSFSWTSLCSPLVYVLLYLFTVSQFPLLNSLIILSLPLFSCCYEPPSPVTPVSPHTLEE